MTVCAHSACDCPGYPGQSVPSNANLKVVCHPTWLLWEPSTVLPIQLRSAENFLLKEVLKIMLMYSHCYSLYSTKKEKKKKKKKESVLKIGFK